VNAQFLGFTRLAQLLTDGQHDEMIPDRPAVGNT
jgi:hypothetical protein